jgi:hypothetical protein
MFNNQNNVARVFQLKKDISCLPQEGKSFVQYLGSMKSLWNKLAVYKPHTTNHMKSLWNKLAVYKPHTTNHIETS